MPVYQYGPNAITAGTPLTISVPNNAPWAAVVISNLSPLLVGLQVGGGYFWLQPFTENLYRSVDTHAPIVVAPQLVAGTTVQQSGSGQLSAIWYGPDEIPSGSWPVALVASALAAGFPSSPQIGVDPLAVNQPVNLSGGGPAVLNLVAQRPYRTILVVVNYPGGTPVTVSTLAQVTAPVAYLQTYFQVRGTGASAGILDLALPLITNTGDTFQVQLTTTAGVTGWTVSVYGVTEPFNMASIGRYTAGVPIYGILPTGTNVRADGRPWPDGSEAFSLSTATPPSSFTAVAAPPAPYRILLQQIQIGIIAGASASLVQMFGRVQGNTLLLAAASAAASNPSLPVGQPYPPQGILLDLGTGITGGWAISTPSSLLVTGTFDLVV